MYIHLFHGFIEDSMYIHYISTMDFSWIVPCLQRFTGFTGTARLALAHAAGRAQAHVEELGQALGFSMWDP